MDITLQAPPVSAPTSVDVRGVTRRFGAVTALYGMSLRALEHEVVCVVGPSGCGKSTLLELVCGLQEPDAGSVAGAPAVYMPQRDLLFPWATALDNAALPLRIAGQSRSAARAQARPLFAELGLGGFERALPAALSGGMRQRVAFLRTLLSGKPVLALDEPFAALDALTRDDMQRFLVDVWRETKKTVIYVTHNVAEAVYLADRIVVLTPHPGTVQTEIKVALARPRDPLSVPFVECQKQVLAHLRREG